MLLHRFDSVEGFPVLESYTTVRGPVRTRVDGKGDDAFLRVTADLCADEPADAVVVLALPIVAVDGRPERLELALVGDQSGCAIWLDAMDANGMGLTYSFGTIDFAGTRTRSADVQKPSERWQGQRLDDSQPVTGVERVDHPPQPLPSHREEETQIVTPPIQFFRLGIRPARSTRCLKLELCSLTVTGDVYRTAPGLTSNGNHRTV